MGPVVADGDRVADRVWGEAGEGGSLVLASAGRVQGEGGGAGLEW